MALKGGVPIRRHCCQIVAEDIMPITREKKRGVLHVVVNMIAKRICLEVYGRHPETLRNI